MAVLRTHTYSAKSRTAGISLLETVIYAGIVALLSVMVINTVSLVTVANAKARIKRSVITEAGFALERMMREVRLADAIDIPGSTLGGNPGVLRLSTIVSSNDTTPTTREFSLSNGTLVMKEGAGMPRPLTSRVQVTNLVFYAITASTTSQAVKVEMTAEREARGITESYNFYDTAVLRRSYQD
ncbi:MAG: hypothetical protein AAB727_00995 [Patescibacteria group bacterium]